MKHLLDFSIRFPRLVIGVLIAICFAACLYIPKIQLQLDGRSLIPEGHVDLMQSDSAASLFNLQDVIVLGVESPQGEDIYTQKTLTQLAKLSHELAAIDGMVPNSVKSLATLPRLFIDNNSIDLEPLLSPDRTAELLPIEQIKKETSALGLNDDILIARDNQAAAIYANAEPDKNRYELLEEVRGICEESRADGNTVYFSGTALAQAVLGRSVMQDLILLIPIVILLLGTLLVFLFKHYIPALVALMEVGMSVILTMGCIGLSGQPIFITTLVLPIILLVIGLSDDVYALSHFFNQAKKDAGKKHIRETVWQTFGGVARPIELTAITTITGLLSLTVTNLLPLKIFGFFGALSIAISSVLTFTLVPALIVLINPGFSPTKNYNHKFLNIGLNKMLIFLNGISPRVLLSTIAVISLSAALLIFEKVKIDDSWISNLSQKSDLVRGDKALNELLAGTMTLELRIDSQSPDGLLNPEFFKVLGDIEKNIKAVAAVGAVHSVYTDVIRMNAALNDLHFLDYRNGLATKAKSIERQEIEQSLLLLSTLKNAPVNNRIDDQYQSTWMTVFIHSANYIIIDEILQAAINTLPDHTLVTPFGDGWISYLTVKLLVNGQIHSILLALFLDFILVAVLFQSIRFAFLIILPVAFSVLCVFAILAILGIPLGIANSMFAAIALGIGIDYTIHMVADYQKELDLCESSREAMKNVFLNTGPPIVISTIVVSLGFSLLLFSQIMPNVWLGFLISLSLIVCAITTLIFVPCFSRIAGFKARRIGGDIEYFF